MGFSFGLQPDKTSTSVNINTTIVIAFRFISASSGLVSYNYTRETKCQAKTGFASLDVWKKNYFSLKTAVKVTEMLLLRVPVLYIP